MDMDFLKKSVENPGNRIVGLLIFVVIFGITSFSTKEFKNSNISTIFQTIIFFVLVVIFINLISKFKNKRIDSLINRVSKIKLNTFKVGVIYLTITFLSLWQLILTPGTPGLRDDWSIPPYHEQVIEWAFIEKEAWLSNGAGFGAQNIYPSEYILRFALGGLTYIFNLNGEWLSKIYLIFIFTLTGLGGFYLGKKLNMQIENAFIVGLFYMLTPVLFSRTVTGYLTYLLSYMLLPFIIGVFLVNTTEKLKIKKTIKLGLLVGLGFTHLNFIVIIPLILFLISFFEENFRDFLKKLGYIILITLIGCSMHLNWIIPLLTDTTINEIIAVKLNTWVESFNPPLTNSMLLLGSTYGFFSEVIQKETTMFMLWCLSSLGLIFLIFTPLVKETKNRVIFKISIITIIFLFLSKGRSPPFGFIFKFLYKNFKVFVLFRDIHNLLIIPCLGYSILLGYSLTNLKELLKQKNNILPLGIIITVILTYSWPFFTGNFGGYLQNYNLHPDYRVLYNNLSNESGDFRILWLPPAMPITYPNVESAGVDPLISFSPKNTMIPILGAHTEQDNYYLVIDNLFHDENITNNIYSILNFAKIKYLIYRDDVVSELPKFHYIPRFSEINEKYTNKQIKNILSEQKLISEIEENLELLDIPKETNFERFKIYSVNEKDFSRISLSEEARLISGGYDSLIKLFNYNLINRDKTVFFTSQVNNPQNLSTVLKDIIILNDDLEMLLTFIDKKYKIEPGDFVITNDADSGWTSYYNWGWYKWDYISQLEDGAFSRTKDNLKIKIKIEDAGKYAIFLKPYFSSDASNITLWIDDTKIETINLHKMYNKGFRWVYLTDYVLDKNEHTLVLSSEEGENAVSLIVITPKEKIDKILEEYNDFMENNSNEIIYEIEKIIDEPKIRKLENVETIFNYINNENYNQLVIINKAGSKLLLSTEEDNAKRYYPLIVGLNIFDLDEIKKLDDIGILNSIKKIQDVESYLTKDILEKIKINYTDYFNSTGGLKTSINAIKEYIYPGFVKINGEGILNISINGENREVICNNSELVYLGEIKLKKGLNNLSFISNSGILINSLMLNNYKTKTLSNNYKVDYNKLSNTLYKLNITSYAPFILLFSESYDKNWILKIGKEEYKPTLCNGFANCYIIDKTGSYTTELYFEKQKYYCIGGLISLIILLSSVILFFK